MPRGNEQKIFWPIRPGEEDADNLAFEDYIDIIKKAKENNGTKFYVKQKEMVRKQNYCILPIIK